MEEGPWIFHGCALVLEEFDGSTAIPVVVPCKVPAWIQIHKIPHLYRTESILKQLAGKVGEEVAVEMKAVSTVGGDFFRVRVNLVAQKPLVRFVTLSPEGRDHVLLQVKFEKIPCFCAHYGMMGHVHLECGTGEYSEDDLQYGDWMVAPEETWHPRTLRVCGSLPGDRDNEEKRGGRTAGRPAGQGCTGAFARGARNTFWREKKTTKMKAIAPASGRQRRPGWQRRVVRRS
jgi:hypothetical protein